MDAFVRRLALRNAAKVALGSLFFGCGGSISTDVPKPDAQAADAAPDGDLDAALPPDAALACTGPTEVDAGDVTEETFQCCLGVVAGVVGDASPWDQNGPDASLVANDPSAVNCCSAIVARVDHEPDGGDLSADYTAAATGADALLWCCNVAFEQGPACTPWGPPAPPPMPLALLEVA
jgi:hypothetical protein